MTAFQSSTRVETRPGSRLRVLLLLMAATACANPSGEETDAISPTAVEVDGHAISLDEVDERLRQDLFEEEFGGAGKAAHLYQSRRQVASVLVDEYLLEQAAKRAGLSPDDWVEAQLAAAPPVSDEDVVAFFEEHRDKMGESPDLEILKPRIVSYLGRLRVDRIQDELRENAQVSYDLPQQRMEVAAVGPSRGPDDAPVTIVEFSDYQCPFCARAEPTIKELLVRYPTQVRLVYRHLPLGFHGQARGAAEAAVCADEQDRFWEYHDLLFANQKKLGADDLVAHAAALDLDMARFESCLADEETAARVQQDVDEARNLGATGTPSFFINGLMLTGSQPIASFESTIDEELQRLQQ